VLKWNMYVACVACRIKVLGYIEDLQSSYIFAEFLYLYQLTLHPSPNTPLISTYIISEDGIEMAKDKVQTVLVWEPPKSLKETQAFLGFANFYPRFIKDLSKICRPLTESTKGDAKKWEWTVAMELAFDELKRRFTTAPILRQFDPMKVCIVETDASDFALGAVLSQKGDDGRLYPVAFHSRKFTLAEINYEIHDKELLAIVDCFKVWRRYLEGAMHTV
jgi:hypothetical protein